MKMIRRPHAFAVFLCPFLLFAFACTKRAAPPTLPIETSCVANWKNLENAWDTYRTAPSAGSGEKLVEELRAASRANETPGCAERVRVHARFLQETEKMEKIFYEPGNRGVEVLDALLMHSDAGYTDELYLLLADGAVHDPRGFLELVTKKYEGKDCPYVTTDPEEFNDVDPKVVVRALTKNALNRRLQAISRVKDRPYSAAREVCVAELRKALGLASPAAK
jgi:hypothetical protein